MFPEIKKNFGFGFMRLPMIGDEVDYEHTIKMVDAFLAAGFNYFDTAHGYIDGKSEIAIRECLAKRHPRESYVLTNKLSPSYFEKKEEFIMSFIADLLAKLGMGVAVSGTQACNLYIIDEPEMPKCLIEK